MKQLFLFISFFIAMSTQAQQIADRMARNNNTLADTTSIGIVTVGTNPSTTAQPPIYSVNKSLLKFGQNQILKLSDSLNSRIKVEIDPSVSAWAKSATKPSYSYAEITSKPTLATVATTGSYTDLSNKPTLFAKPESINGITGSDGNYTWIFSKTYSVPPAVIPVIIGRTNTQFVKLVSVSTTQAVVNVTNINNVLGLLPTYSNVNGAIVQLTAIEK